MFDASAIGSLVRGLHVLACPIVVCLTGAGSGLPSFGFGISSVSSLNKVLDVTSGQPCVGRIAQDGRVEGRMTRAWPHHNTRYGVQLPHLRTSQWASAGPQCRPDGFYSFSERDFMFSSASPIRPQPRIAAQI